MAQIFWLGFGIAAFASLLGLLLGARSRSTSALTGWAMGTFVGVMAAFPRLAIGLSTS